MKTMIMDYSGLILYFIIIFWIFRRYGGMRRRKKIYKYFISYEATSMLGRRYRENTDIHLEEKITSLQRVREIENYIFRNKEGVADIVVISFCILNKSERYAVTDLSK